MNKPAVLRGVVFYSRLILGFVFFFASLSKVADIKGFAVMVGDYQLLPQFLLIPFSYILSWTELVCGVLLIFGVQLRIIGALLSAMLVMFMLSTGITLFRGLDVDCGCFDIPLFGSTKIGWQMIARNVIFLFMSLSLVFLKEKKNESGGAESQTASGGS